MLGKPLVRFCEGPGRNSDHGRDPVAPPGNQAANREHKHRPTVREVPGLLETPRLSSSRSTPATSASARSSCSRKTGPVPDFSRPGFFFSS